MKKPLYITGIDIRDFKRIKTFHLSLEPKGGLVTIGGRNAQGKSSALDAVASALFGKAPSVKNPVRDGCDDSAIRLFLSDDESVRYKVVRQYTSEGDTKVSIVLEDETKAKVSNPAQFLRELLGDRTADPAKFLHAEPREQRAELIKIAGINVDEIDSKIKAAKSHLDHLSTVQREAEIKAKDAPLHVGVPDEEISILDLTNQLREVDENNAIVMRQNNATSVLANEVSALTSQLERLEQQELAAQRELIEAQNAVISQRSAIASAEELLVAARTQLGTLTPIDPEPIRCQINAAYEVNSKVQENKYRKELHAIWQQAESQFAQAESAYKAAQAERKKALADATFPVDGLSFDSEQVLLNGKPFSDASTAERIRTSIHIAIAKAGRLAPILIWQGSSFDNDMLTIIAEEAERLGCQVIAEIVSNPTDDGYDRACTIIMEDGVIADPSTVKETE